MASYEDVVQRLRRATHVVALTGAGVSAASGIPTFRGADGLWKKIRAETLATPEAFANDPKLVWEWYDWRRGVVRQARPNQAHEVLGRWTRERAGFTLVTQNVDGLHERAGADRLVRLHGPILARPSGVRRPATPAASTGWTRPCHSRACLPRVPIAAASFGPPWCGSANRSTRRSSQAHRTPQRQLTSSW